MDITKIDEARKLFTQFEDTEGMHKIAIEEFGKLADKSFNFHYLNHKEFKVALEKLINTHYEMLKQELKAKIAQL